MVNPLPGNPHAEPANYADIEPSPYTKAQGLLAIAYELRTANLIASLQTVKLSDGRALAPDLETAVKAMRQVAERLDLDVGGEVK